jgi:tRNA G18 (ribose-2'-O)-methylase SpoU
MSRKISNETLVKLSHEELLRRQAEKIKQAKLPFCVVLNNIRSAHNVGSIFRTCDGAGVEKLWLCGITSFPPNRQLLKTSLGSEKSIEWGHREDLIQLIDELKEKRYEIVLLEQIKGSIWYEDYRPKRPVCLVVGNEIEGIADNLVQRCDTALEIEMDGMKNSLNVSVAFGIVAFHVRNVLKDVHHGSDKHN